VCKTAKKYEKYQGRCNLTKEELLPHLAKYCWICKNAHNFKILWQSN